MGGAREGRTATLGNIVSIHKPEPNDHCDSIFIMKERSTKFSKYATM